VRVTRARVADLRPKHTRRRQRPRTRATHARVGDAGVELRVKAAAIRAKEARVAHATAARHRGLAVAVSILALAVGAAERAVATGERSVASTRVVGPQAQQVARALAAAVGAGRRAACVGTAVHSATVVAGEAWRAHACRRPLTIDRQHTGAVAARATRRRQHCARVRHIADAILALKPKKGRGA
jgi:hypothetical protein